MKTKKKLKTKKKIITTILSFQIKLVPQALAYTKTYTQRTKSKKNLLKKTKISTTTTTTLKPSTTTSTKKHSISKSPKNTQIHLLN